MKLDNKTIKSRSKTRLSILLLALLLAIMPICLCACYETEPNETEANTADTTEADATDHEIDSPTESESGEAPQEPVTADTEERSEPATDTEPATATDTVTDTATDTETETTLETKTETEPETEPHICKLESGYDASGHYLYCAECGNIKDRAEHIFDNACDASCNACGYTREITHSYEEKYDSSEHYMLCSVCGEEKDRAEHIFDNACDTSCNGCGYTREITHSFEEKYDSSEHYMLCSVCGAEKDRAEHVFDNACDTGCNVCGYTREITHSYEEKYDSSEHYMLCTVCGAEKDRAEHVFDNACDRTCNVCGYFRSIEHRLSGWSSNTDRHWRVCRECRLVLSYSKHVYDGDCDATCNECGHIRVAPHRCTSNSSYCDGTYHWGVCADCGAIAQKVEHTFGSDKKCTVCGFKSGQPYEVIDKLISSGSTVNATATRLMSLGKSGNYKVAQGACTDGKYVYIILENQNTGGEGYQKESHYCKIFKIDLATYKTVKVSDPLPVDHGNDCAYNSRTGQIIICHNAPNKKYLTFVDAETLELVKTVTGNKYKMFAVAYNANYDKYVVGIANYYDYGILSSSLAYEKRVNGTDTGYTKQGIDCDDKYIYLLQYKSNVISVHDWNGNYVGTIKLTNVTNEPEAIFHIGDEFYMTSYVSGGKGAVLYKLTLG